MEKTPEERKAEEERVAALVERVQTLNVTALKEARAKRDTIEEEYRAEEEEVEAQMEEANDAISTLGDKHEAEHSALEDAQEEELKPYREKKTELWKRDDEIKARKKAAVEAAVPTLVVLESKVGDANSAYTKLMDLVANATEDEALVEIRDSIRALHSRIAQSKSSKQRAGLQEQKTSLQKIFYKLVQKELYNSYKVTKA